MSKQEKRPNKLGYVRPKRYKTVHDDAPEVSRESTLDTPVDPETSESALETGPAVVPGSALETRQLGDTAFHITTNVFNTHELLCEDRNAAQSDIDQSEKLLWIEDFRTNHPSPIEQILEPINDNDTYGDIFSSFIKEDYYAQSVLFEDEEAENIFPSEATDCPETEEKVKKEEPIYAGHFLPLHVSMLLIWMYAVTHSLTSPQFEDLLALINLHLMFAHPALSSMYKFKTFFSEIESPIKKHFYCSRCLCNIDGSCKRCPNEYCNQEIKTNADKSYFIEINVESRLKSMFKRPDFCDSLKQRFKRNKHKVDNIEDIYDGSIYKSLSCDDGPLSSKFPYNLSFTLNTDGIPVFKSSKLSIWPMYLMINELPFKQRKKSENMILCGLWFGAQKPFMMSFADPLHQSLKNLESGIEICANGTMDVCKAFLICLSADLPARSMVLNMNQFNGNHSCIKCIQSGKNFRTTSGGNVHVFPYNTSDPTGPARADISRDAFEAHQANKTVNGIKGPSFLLLHKSFNCAQGTTIDYMHCICLGICRLLSKLWFLSKHSSEIFSLYSSIELIDSRLSKIKPPHTLSRLPRTISEHFKYWKASELRSWLFYYSMPVLFDIMSPIFWYHYCSFVLGIYILCKGSLSEGELLVSQNLINYFVFTFNELYGDKYMTLNIHQLLHLPDNVRKLGPLWSTSCFPFENANGDILKLFHGTQYIDIQIVNAINVLQTLPSLTDAVSKASPARTLIDKLVKKEKTQTKFSCYFLGKGDAKILSPEVYILVCDALKAPVHKLTFYKRAVIHSLMYHSSEYSRVTSRNSYTVQYLNEQRFVRYGHVNWFASHTDQSGEKKDLCFIHEMQEANLNLVIPDSERFPEGFVNFLKMKCSHIFPVSKLNKKEVVVPVESILSLCVFVEGESHDFVCKEPNSHEINM